MHPYSDPSSGLGPLVATDLSRSYAGAHGVQQVLDGLSLTASPGTRVGLIGENGSGKSTLLRILAGVDLPDSGQVRAPADLVHLPQEPVVPPVGAVVDHLLGAALRPLRAAVAELEQLALALAAGREVGDEYDRVLAWATQHEAWDADRRAVVTATALGVGDLAPDRPLSTLSGGQRSRLALAAALVRKPAVLLLDEPTNHLDGAALELLESALLELPGVVVAASHDRTFLDAVCTELVDLDAGALGSDGSGGRRFGGTFTAYREHQAESRRRWEQTYADQQAEIGRLREQARIGTDAVARGRGPRDNDKFIHQFKGANVERAQARRVHDAQLRLALAEQDQVRRTPKPLTFAGGLAVGTGDGLVVAVRDLVVAGDGKPRVVAPVLDVRRGERLLVTGANGTGKSTLLHVLAGRVVPDAGTVTVAARRVGLLEQDPTFARPGRTALATYRTAVGTAADVHPLGSLGLLAPRDQGKEVGALSLGQRRRLALAVAIATGPDLLLLDEPTNHLSLALATELEEALGTSAGTVVVTSHDRWLLRRWAGTTYGLG